MARTMSSSKLFLVSLLLGGGLTVWSPVEVVLADNTCDGDEFCVEATVGLPTAMPYNNLRALGEITCSLDAISDDLNGTDLILTDRDALLESGENATVTSLNDPPSNPNQYDQVLITWTPRVGTNGNRVDVLTTWTIDVDGASNGQCNGGGSSEEIQVSKVFSIRVAAPYDTEDPNRIKFYVGKDGSAGDTPLDLRFSGRGWFSLSTPYYVAGNVVKTTPKTSVTVTGLAGKTVRVIADIQTDTEQLNNGFGLNSAERPSDASVMSQSGLPNVAVHCATCAQQPALSVGSGESVRWERLWSDSGLFDSASPGLVDVDEWVDTNSNGGIDTGDSEIDVYATPVTQWTDRDGDGVRDFGEWTDVDADGYIDMQDEVRKGWGAYQGQDVWSLRVPDSGLDGSVTFDIDIQKGTKKASIARLVFEINSTQDYDFNNGNGDVTFAIDLYTDPLVGFDGSQPSGGQYVAKATTSSSQFRTDSYNNGVSLLSASDDPGFTYEYLDPVPACSSAADVGPCLQSITSGWALRLKDGWTPALASNESLALKPYRSVSPFEANAGDEVQFQLRLPTGDIRSQCWGVEGNSGSCGIEHLSEQSFSSANASSYFNSFSYDKTNSTYGVATVSMNIRATTRVLTYSNSGVADECQAGLKILSVGGVPTVIHDADGDGYDSGEEAVKPCQNQENPIFIEKVLLREGQAWVRTIAAHGLANGAQVTICCLGEPFDGTKNIVVADPPNALFPGRYFYISTLGTSYATIDWGRFFGLNVDSGEGRSGIATLGTSVRFAESSLGTDVFLRVPPSSALAGGFVTTNAQGFAFGPGVAAGQSFDFGVAGPSYSKENEIARTTRRSDGFFQVCMPSAFLTEVFNLTLANAASSLQTTRADSGVSTTVTPTATAGTCGVGAGLKLELPNFSFSAPYFDTRKASVESPSSGGGGSGGGGSSSSTKTTPKVTVPAVTQPPSVAPISNVASQLPPSQIPGRGAVVQVNTSPPASLASAVGMRASTNSVSIALQVPSVGLRSRPTEYEISLVIPGKGVARKVTVRAGANGGTVSASFPRLTGSEYVVRIVGKSKDGSPLGRWRSPTVRLRN